MSYKLKEEDWQAVAKIAERLAVLPEGQSITLRDNRDSIDRLRYLIYAWMFETDQRGVFKLMRIEKEALTIKRKGTIKPKEDLSIKIEEFVSQFIEVEDEQEFQGLVRNAIQRGELTANEGVFAMSEWKRIQGRT